MTNLPEEIQDELVSFVRDFASHGLNSLIRSGWEIDAAKLVAKLPPPVDPDIEEARKIAADTLNRLGASAEQIAADDILSGQRDDAIIVHAILAGMKRARELERASQ